MALVTFTSKSWADITMFGEVAVNLLKMMGHSGTVPGAMLAEDIPAALAQLKTALASGSVPSSSAAENDEEEEKVSISVRAHPLIELLTAAAEQKCDVMWHN